MDSRVTLPSNHIDEARKLVNLRYKMNRKNGIKNRKAANRSQRYIEQQGIGGEIATALFLGLDYDHTYNIRKRGADMHTGDRAKYFTFPEGSDTLDTKTATDETSPLIVAEYHKDEPNDIYVLATGKMPVFTIRGWATPDEVFKPEHFTYRPGKDPTYEVPQHALHKEFFND